MINDYQWLTKKTYRSVDHVYLWSENPRLNLDSEYRSIRDFADELIHENKEKDGLLDLAKSIVTKSFIPADPIVVWQNPENKRYYVAEGNRRILVLKMLRNPNLAPKAIRNSIQKLSNKIDKTTIKKVPVSVAPTFEDAEWYISQRHSTANLQRRWETEQQLKWVMSLYNKYDGNIEIIQSKIDLSESELKRLIRLFKLKKFITESKELFSEEEYDLVTSIRFPITTFERFFTNSAVKNRWGLEFSDYDFVITSEKDSFIRAAIQLVKRIILDKDDPKKLDSRTLGTIEQVEQVLDELPPVVQKKSSDENSGENLENDNEDVPEIKNNEENDSDSDSNSPPIKPKDDPSRSRLIHSSYFVHTDKYRIEDLFNELKQVPFRWKNSIAASIRIFIDLIVLNYIENKNVKSIIESEYKKSLRQITLSQRLEFLKSQPLSSKAKAILTKFLNNSNDYSLDVLNGYQHNNDTHYIQKKFLNNFWNFLFPLIKELVEISEND